MRVDGVAQIKVKGDDISIATAAEQFLSKDTEAIKNIAMQTLEGHLRAILGTMTVEDIYQNRDAFAQKVQEVAAGDMANMGLGIVSFTIRDIKDSQGYLDALGKPRIAQVKRDAQIAQAEADRDAMIKSSQAIAGGAGSEVRGGYQDRRGPAGLPIERRAVPGGGEPEEGRGRPGLRFAEVQDRPACEGRGGAGQHHREAEADRAAAAGNHAQAARTGSERAEAGRRRALQGRDAGQRPQVPVGDRGCRGGVGDQGDRFCGCGRGQGDRYCGSGCEQGARSGRGLRHRGARQSDGRGDARQGRVLQAIQRSGGGRDDHPRAARGRRQDQRTAVARPRRWSSSTPAAAWAAARAS